MRKQLPNGRGGRVQFSIPDREWRWFSMVSAYYGFDPIDEVIDCAASGCNASEIRETCREFITRFLSEHVCGFSGVPSASARSQNARPS